MGDCLNKLSFFFFKNGFIFHLFIYFFPRVIQNILNYYTLFKCIRYDCLSVHRFKCFKQLQPYVRNGFFCLNCLLFYKRLGRKNSCLYKGKVNDCLK